MCSKIDVIKLTGANPVFMSVHMFRILGLREKRNQ